MLFEPNLLIKLKTLDVGEMVPKQRLKQTEPGL